MSILWHSGRKHGDVLSELSRADKIAAASLPGRFRGEEWLALPNEISPSGAY
jgi:hypothetical protein